MRFIVGLLFAAQVPLWYPAWSGREPLRVCVAPSAQQYRYDALRAFNTWLAHTPLEWEEVSDCGRARTIAYSVSRFEGPFDATGFYPVPMFQEPYAGDVVLNARVDWSAQRARVLPTLVHETGHAFGLPDMRNPSYVMDATSISTDKLLLHQDEARIMRCLYWGHCK